MESLLLPLAIFLTVALWGAIEHGRKFRREFRLRGKTWETVCTAMEGAGGTLIVDTLWGPQRGLGHPVIWFSPQTLSQEANLAEEVQGTAFLVRCPRGLKSVAALRERFGDGRIVQHTWSINLALVESSR